MMVLTGGRSLSKVPVSIGLYVMLMTTLITTINTLFLFINISGAFHVVFSWLTVIACISNVIVVLMCCVPKCVCRRVRTCRPSLLHALTAPARCTHPKHCEPTTTASTCHNESWYERRMGHCHCRWDGGMELNSTFVWIVLGGYMFHSLCCSLAPPDQPVNCDT